MKVYIVFEDNCPAWGTDTYMNAVFDNEKDASNLAVENDGWYVEAELNTICNEPVAFYVE